MIYYYKGLPIVTPFTISSNRVIKETTSVNLKTQRVVEEGQRWELSFSLRTDVGEGDYMVDSIIGDESVQSMLMPQLNSVLKALTVPSGTLNPQTTYTPGTSTLNITYSSGSVTGTVLPKGTFVSFSNHTKIYMIRDTVNITASPFTINIFPALVAQVTSGSALRHPNSINKPTLNYLVDLDSLRGITYEDGVLVDPGTIKLIEAT